MEMTLCSLSLWDVSAIRCHLETGFEKGKIEPFPLSRRRRVKSGRCQGSEVHAKLYCSCSMPYDPDRGMIQCDRCNKWYHFDCVGIKNSENVSDLAWKCTTCV